MQRDPVDQFLTLWTNKTGLQGGLGGKRSCALWMSEDLMVLQLDPLDHHFDPEGQAPTLWASTSWSTGSEDGEYTPVLLICFFHSQLQLLMNRSRAYKAEAHHVGILPGPR
jgi:hypothetical protein